MKITTIDMSTVTDGKPFKNAQWRMATPTEKATIYAKMANINNARKVAV